jgi:hypothetical protein
VGSAGALAGVVADGEHSVPFRGKDLVRRDLEVGHLQTFAEARPWITRRADLIVDATGLTAEEVAARVWEVAKEQIA